MAPHSSTLAWKIPWAEEPGRLHYMGSLRVGHDWATSLSFSFSCIGEGIGNPLQCSCLENPRDGGAWWAAVYEVSQSQTRLKRLSSSVTWLQISWDFLIALQHNCCKWNHCIPILFSMIFEWYLFCSIRMGVHILYPFTITTVSQFKSLWCLLAYSICYIPYQNIS